MPWLKRNLGLVIGGLVAIGLLGVAGYFLFTKIQAAQEVSDQLSQKTEELKRLSSRDPHPGTDKVDNIGSAKKEEEKLKAFLGQIQQHFLPMRQDTNQITSPQFRELLDNAISELQRGAEMSGVKVPDDYRYTFAAQKTATIFASNIVDSLATQLKDIKDLCQILFDAKIVALKGVRRMPIATEDSGTQDYLTDVKGITNNWTVATPYEVSFEAFSPELATVLEGIVRSKNCFVVRDLSIARADAPQVEDTSTTSAYPDRLMGGGAMSRYGMGGAMSRYGMGMSREMMQRYGLGPRPAEPQQPTQPTAPTRTVSRGGNTVFLEEKALRMTLSVFSVKLKPPGKAGAEPPPPAEPAAAEAALQPAALPARLPPGAQ